MKRHLLILLILITGAFTAGLTDAPVAVSAQPARVIPDSEIAKWNYKTVEVLAGQQRDWEKSQFGDAKIRIQRIKSKFQVRHWPNAYYRFTISEETYPSPGKAAARLKGLFEIPPGVDTKSEAELVLRKGFQDGARVILVSTDVVLFDHEELPTIVKKAEAFANRR